MEYFDSLIIPAVIQEMNVQENRELNFENEASIEQRELAHQDLTSAKVLAKASQSSDDKHIKKSLNRKAKQAAMESVEHAQKSVTYADEDHKKIQNEDVHSKLEKTHNNSFMQREQEAAGIQILTKEDINKLNSTIKKKNGEKSPYNAVRFTDQEISDQAVNDAIDVAEKAVTNLEQKVSDNKRTKIQMGNFDVLIDI